MVCDHETPPRAQLTHSLTVVDTAVVVVDTEEVAEATVVAVEATEVVVVDTVVVEVVDSVVVVSYTAEAARACLNLHALLPRMDHADKKATA